MNVKNDKPELEKITTDEATNIVNIMFARLNPKDRSYVLNMIDNFIINHLGISEINIPWFNQEKKKVDDYIHVLNLMRLAYARLFNHAEGKFKKKIHWWIKLKK